MPQVVSDCHFSATGCQLKDKKGITLLFAWLSSGFPQIQFYLGISKSTAEHSDNSQLFCLCVSVCSIEVGKVQWMSI